MNEINFCYWLQGFFEMTDTESLTPEQIKIIKEHLQLVLKKETKFSLGGIIPITESTPTVLDCTPFVMCDNTINHDNLDIRPPYSC